MPTVKSGSSDMPGSSGPGPVTVTLYNLLWRLGSLYWQQQRLERYFNNNLPALLPPIIQQTYSSCSPKQVKRFIKYWQLAYTVICNNVYQLTGHQLTAAEERRIILASVFAPLFDDLLDEGILSQDQITALIDAPEQHRPREATDTLVKEIYLELLQTVPDRNLFVQQLQATSWWQNESLKQRSDTIGEEALYQITYNKSYFGILSFCTLLDHYPSREVEELLYPVAGLMQLTNDAFDVWKDIHDGVYTLPNLYRRFDHLQQLFLAEIASINSRLARLPYAYRGKRSFSITSHSLHAMGWMSLEQLREVTANVGSVGELRSLSRKALVCDLDNFGQQVKWIKQIRRLANYNQSPGVPPRRFQPGPSNKSRYAAAQAR